MEETPKNKIVLIIKKQKKMKKLFLALVVAFGMATTLVAAPVASIPTPEVQEVTQQKDVEVIVIYNDDGTIKDIIVIKHKGK